MLDLHRVQPDLQVFDACHALRGGGLGAAPHVERTALPAPGGVLDQPALLMATIDLMERVTNDEVVAMVKEAKHG